jgi:hypothetical protein
MDEPDDLDERGAPGPGDREQALRDAKAYVRDMLARGASVADADAAIARVDLNDRRPEHVVDEVHAELLAERAHEALRPGDLARGAAGAVAGAVVAAAAWAAVVSVTGYQIGFVALGVGLVVGGFARRASGGRTGSQLVVVVAALTVVAYALGKYLTIWAQVRKDVPGLSPLSRPLFELVRHDPGAFVDGFDLLWLGIALSVAIGAVRPVHRRLAPPRGRVPDR